MELSLEPASVSSDYGPRRFPQSIGTLYEEFEKCSFKPEERGRTDYLCKFIETEIPKFYQGMIEVPQVFVEEHPRIIFLPVDVDGSPGLFPISYASGEVVDTPDKQSLREDFYEHNFHTLKILDIRDLKTILEWCDNHLNENNEGLVKHLYYRAMFTFIENLELYKLTQYPNAMIFRLGNGEDEEDIPFSERKRLGGWSGARHSLIRGLSNYRVSTHWFRRDIVNETNYLGKTQLRKSTVGEAEKGHLISLDSAAVESLMLISLN